MIFVVVLCWMVPAIISSAQDRPDIIALLSEMNTHRRHDKLSILFRIGDERIGDLLMALDNPDREISIRAQVVIRYLGNNVGAKGLGEWYDKQTQYPVAGPVPLPITDRDLKYIYIDYVGKPLAGWHEPEKYIYALALDDSPRAKTALAEMLRSAGSLEERYHGGYALKRIQTSNPTRLLRGSKDIAKLIKDNLFFLTPEGRKYARVSVIGMNGAGDKALVEVYVNFGVLMEQWFHVVIRKQDDGWKYYSVTPVAVS